MSEEVITSAPVAEGQTSPDPNPWQMDMGDLAKAAGIDGNTPTVQPQSVEPTPQAQPQVQPSQYTIEQNADGFQLRLAPEYGGEVFKGKDLNEVVTKLAASKAEGNVYIKQLKQWADDTHQNPANRTAMPQQPTTPEQEAQAAMLQAQAVREFFQKEVLTPELKASIVADTLGVPAEELPRVLEQYQSTFQDNYQRNQLRDFQLSCPEYADTPEQSDALVDALIDLHGGVSNIPQNYIPSAEEMKIAWAVALHSGKAQPYIHRTPPPAPKFPVMPTVNAASQSLTGGQNPWAMDMDQLAAMAGIQK